MKPSQTLIEELELTRKACLLEKRQLILYGLDIPPAQWVPEMLDLSVRVLGELLGYEYDELAEDVVRWQNDTYREAMTEGFGGKDLVLAYRGGGKSTWGTITRAIWLALRNHDARIGIASESQDLPKAFLLEIDGHLTENDELIEMFGTFKPKPGDRRKWDEKRKTILQRRARHKEPTFHAFGIGSQSAGYHYDFLFGDDLVTHRGSRTKKVRENLADWHDSTYGGLGMVRTIYHYVGTPYFPGDLWDRMENGRPDESRGIMADVTLKIPAEYLKDGKRTPNSPSRLPLKALDIKLEDIGRIHYASQYLMDRSKMVGKVFSLADFNYYDPDDQVLNEERKSWPRYLYFDLKATSKNVGDYFVGFAIAVSPDKKQVHCVDIVRVREGMARQRQIIIRMTQKHRAVKTGIEAVQMQAAFAEEIREFTLLPIDPVKVEVDKVMRAIRITPLVEGGKVWLPMDDTELGHRFAPFFEELVTFPDGDYDDTIDAFVGVLTMAMYGGAAAAAGGGKAPDSKKPTRSRANYGKRKAKYK